MKKLTTRKVVWSVVLLLALSFFALFLYGFLEMFRPKDVSKMPPENIFQWLVCERMPLSVTNIKATGYIMFTGHSIDLACDIEPKDFETILARGNFSPVEKHLIHNGAFQEQLETIQKPEFYQRRGGEFDDFRTVFLLSSPAHDKLFVYYFRP